MERVSKSVTESRLPSLEELLSCCNIEIENIRSYINNNGDSELIALMKKLDVSIRDIIFNKYLKILKEENASSRGAEIYGDFKSV